MSSKWVLAASLATGMGIVACGGASTGGDAFPKSDAGESGGTSGGSGGHAGGTASGGTSSSGGAGAGTGGIPGAGGEIVVPGDSGACPAPAAAGRTRICLTIAPEVITPRAEPRFDEKGVLVVQVFDTPHPPKGDAAGAVALDGAIFPKDAATGGTTEIALADLKEIRLEKAFPATVYLRAIFIDDKALFGMKDTLGPGAWIGGLNLADGITEDEPLLPVTLSLQQGNAVTLPLTALRAFRAKVHLAATPLGDGAGPLSVIAVGNPVPSDKLGVLGFAQRKCVDLAAGDVTLNGFLAGPGPAYVVGSLNDLLEPGDLPEGAVTSLNLAVASPMITNKVTYDPKAYLVETSVDLAYITPFGGDAGVPANACSDLKGDDGGAPDAG